MAIIQFFFFFGVYIPYSLSFFYSYLIHLRRILFYINLSVNNLTLCVGPPQFYWKLIFDSLNFNLSFSMVSDFRFNVFFKFRFSLFNSFTLRNFYFHFLKFFLPTQLVHHSYISVLRRNFPSIEPVLTQQLLSTLLCPKDFFGYNSTLIFVP